MDQTTTSGYPPLSYKVDGQVSDADDQHIQDALLKVRLEAAIEKKRTQRFGGETGVHYAPHINW